jgi:hypothetical protein
MHFTLGACGREIGNQIHAPLVEGLSRLFSRVEMWWWPKFS